MKKEDLTEKHLGKYVIIKGVKSCSGCNICKNIHQLELIYSGTIGIHYTKEEIKNRASGARHCGICSEAEIIFV